ncbi:MAG: cation transporter, partial [Bacteroidetes bacterium HGW-Bacteroidetes-13]
DFYVKYGLNAVEGVSEVASVGGYVQEYQIDVNPEALKAYRIGLDKVASAVKNSNRDIGAQTVEINKAEYLVRGLGYVKSIEDLENAVVAVNSNIPILIKDLAVVHLGPAPRRGVLDKGGAEVVGGVVVARYGANPLAVINQVKEKIKVLAPGLPTKVLKDGTVSRVTIVPFYDRTQLIHETIGTLETALSHEILISILVVIVLVLNLRASILISSLLPVAVLMTFVVMRYTGIDANVVALSGIAIAIGVMVDVGIVFVENIIRHLELPENKGKKGKALLELIHCSTVEVSGAITTALATTVVSFLPVFFMENAEGKLFKPLAFTKTFALSASFILGIVVLPTLAYWFFATDIKKEKTKKIGNISLALAGVVFAIYFGMWLPLALTLIGLKNIFHDQLPQKIGKYTTEITLGIVLTVTVFLLTEEWRPLGHGNNLLVNFFFTVILLGLILGVLMTIV